MTSKKEAQTTLDLVRNLLRQQGGANQEEICAKLETYGHHVAQSTVSRVLKRLGAIRIHRGGRWVYELPGELGLPPIEKTFSDLVTQVQSNSVMIVVSCKPGSAPLIARYLDQHIGRLVMGTIAGDDTIFIAPKRVSKTQQIHDKISHILHFAV